MVGIDRLWGWPYYYKGRRGVLFYCIDRYYIHNMMVRPTREGALFYLVGVACRLMTSSFPAPDEPNQVIEGHQ